MDASLYQLCLCAILGTLNTYKYNFLKLNLQQRELVFDLYIKKNNELSKTQQSNINNEIQKYTQLQHSDANEESFLYAPDTLFMNLIKIDLRPITEIVPAYLDYLFTKLKLSAETAEELYFPSFDVKLEKLSTRILDFILQSDYLNLQK